MKTMAVRNIWLLRAGLAAALVLNFAFWKGSHDTFAKWEGVPPVPSRSGALMMTLNDAQFSYRFGALTLQDLGNYGGQVTNLREYDYKKLGQWFWLLNDLDPASNHVPMAAAYYFGGTMVKEDVAVIVDYLATVGQNPVGNKWRWLAHAVFLARHRLKDMDLALDLAYKLSKMQPVGDTMPAWARQMPAFVLDAQGEKADARHIITEILRTTEDLHPNEVNFMTGYLVEDLGMTKEEADALRQERALNFQPYDEKAVRPSMPAPMPN